MCFYPEPNRQNSEHTPGQFRQPRTPTPDRISQDFCAVGTPPNDGSDTPVEFLGNQSRIDNLCSGWHMPGVSLAPRPEDESSSYPTGCLDNLHFSEDNLLSERRPGPLNEPSLPPDTMSRAISWESVDTLGGLSGSCDQGTPLSTDASLTRAEFRQLCVVFGQHCHAILPSFDPQILHDNITRNWQDALASPLCWAVAGCAAWYQGDTGSTSRGGIWLKKACTLIDECTLQVSQPLTTLQASVCIIHHAYVTASTAAMGLQLGKACRLVTMLGWDHLDDESQTGSREPYPVHDLHLESRQRVIWVLFLLDRAAGCMFGWPFGLRDDQFLVNYPRKEYAGLIGNCPQPVERFSVNLAALITSDTLNSAFELRDTMSLIFRAYVLLGRIADYHSNVHLRCETSSPGFTQLEGVIAKFNILVIRFKSGSSGMSLEARRLSIWLQSVIGMCTILLYHPIVDRAPRSGTKADSGFRACVSASKKMAEMIRSETFCSIEPLMNPMLLPSFFLASRFLTIAWRETSNDEDKADVDMILMLVSCMADTYNPIATKYHQYIRHDVELDPADIALLRQKTGNYCVLGHSTARLEL